MKGTGSGRLTLFGFADVVVAVVVVVEAVLAVAVVVVVAVGVAVATVVTTAVLFVNTDVITHVLPSKTSKDKAYNLQVLVGF